MKMPSSVSWSSMEADVIAEFETMTQNAHQMQIETLEEILRTNSQAEYLQRNGLSGRTDVGSFTSCLPLITHSDIEPDIQRIADGDTAPILTTEPVTVLSLSSGTSKGKTKMLPFSKDLLLQTSSLYQIAGAYRTREFPLKPGGRIMEFLYCGKEFRTKGGLKMGTATTILFKNRDLNGEKKKRAYGCSPDDVIFCSDPRHAMYCHLLCGLIFRADVQFINSTFVYSIVEAFSTLQKEWERLAHDLQYGQLSSHVLDPRVRHAISHILRPDPDLASKVRAECSIGFYNIIGRLWPNAKYVYSIMTGAMMPYLPKMRHYAGSLPLVSADYGASESWIGVNVNPKAAPEDVVFTLVPNFAYFEFIPLDGGPTISLSEVKVGHEYEIVITTYAGLYRYRLGDVVQVVGFYNNSPQLSYVRRKDVLLIVNIDKNNENDLRLAVEKATSHFQNTSLELDDYTSCVDLSTNPGHYVIFWELKDPCNISDHRQLFQQCCTTLDTSFIDPGYRGPRAMNTINPLELCILKPGTFKRLIDLSLSNGAALSQYKTPRIITSPQLIKLLQEGVAERFYSL